MTLLTCKICGIKFQHKDKRTKTCSKECFVQNQSLDASKRIGKRNGFYDKHHTKESKIKLSKANRGKTHTDKAKINMSIASRGKKHSLEHVINQAAATRGQTRTNETKIKISIAKLGHTTSEETKTKMSVAHRGEKNGFYGKTHSKKSKDKISVANSGENSPWWQGGISFEPYSPKFNEKLKRYIKERDNHRCQICHVTQNNTEFHIHHTNYNKNNVNPNFLITLCHSCHAKTSFDRNHWERYFNMPHRVLSRKVRSMILELSQA